MEDIANEHNALAEEDEDGEDGDDDVEICSAVVGQSMDPAEALKQGSIQLTPW